jgi:hypothetical protein
MTEYRIAEEHNRFRIQYSNGMVWHDLNQLNVPRFFDSLADARSWVATIKRGVVYHDAEEVPIWPYPTIAPVLKDEEATNLAQDERKAEDDTSDGIKPLEWFRARIGETIWNITNGYLCNILDDIDARRSHNNQHSRGWRYKDQ